MTSKNFFSEIRYSSDLVVVGCGWLGFPFALGMVNRGLDVIGTTTSTEKLEKLQQQSVRPLLLHLTAEKIIHNPALSAPVIVLNIPPGRRNPDVVDLYPRIIGSVLDMIEETSHLIFVSSTSVYADDLDFIDESTPPAPRTEAGQAIVRAEQLIVDSGLPYTILRFGGLAGPGRHPGRFLAGRSGISGGNQAINFLHLHDALGVLNFFSQTTASREIYNVISTVHPKKSEFYTKVTQDLGLAVPSFTAEQTCALRIISSEKLVKNTGYKFIFPDPMEYTFR